MHSKACSVPMAQQYRSSSVGLLSTSRPVRRVITKSRKRVVGYFASPKCDALIEWESQLERDYLTLLEMDPHVVHFVAQPVRLAYELEGRFRTYVPDFCVQYRDRKVIAEVKCDRDAADPENQRLFAVFHERFAEQGLQYEVVTESAIRIQPRLGNARLLLRYRGMSVPAEFRFALDLLLSGHRDLTLAEIESRFPEPHCREWIFSLATTGKVRIDLNKPIADSIIVARGETL